jgi:hypothetical protein
MAMRKFHVAAMFTFCRLKFGIVAHLFRARLGVASVQGAPGKPLDGNAPARMVEEGFRGEFRTYGSRKHSAATLDGRAAAPDPKNGSPQFMKRARREHFGGFASWA